MMHAVNTWCLKVWSRFRLAFLDSKQYGWRNNATNNPTYNVVAFSSLRECKRVESLGFAGPGVTPDMFSPSLPSIIRNSQL